MTKEELGKFAFDRFIAGAKSDTARDYWYSKFKQEQTRLDLDKLESKLDDSLSKETTESLTEWLNNKRNNMTEQEMNRLSEKLDRIEERTDNMNRILDKIIEEIDKHKDTPSKTITNEYDGEIMTRYKLNK
jgi:hypothetical protein